MLPSIWFFDDKIWIGLFSQDTIEKMNELEHKPKSPKTAKLRFGVSIVIGIILAYLSIPIGESYESFDRKRVLVKYQSQSKVIEVML